MASPHKLSLRVIVNGTDTEVDANENAPLQVVAQHALNQTHQESRPLSEWELRDESGNLLELDRTVSSYSFTPQAVLYLQPRVGVNGISPNKSQQRSSQHG